ncbi:MAG: lipoyl domain-containing protein [Pirellulales bacterium]
MSQREIRMPDLSTTDSQVTLLRWLIEVGQRVERGQPLVEIETDKAIMNVESSVSGILLRTCADIGQSIDVGQLIAVVDVPHRGRLPEQPKI